MLKRYSKRTRKLLLLEIEKKRFFNGFSSRSKLKKEKEEISEREKKR